VRDDSTCRSDSADDEPSLGRACDASPSPAAELPPNVSISAISEFAALVSGPARTSMLLALLDEGSLTAKALAEIAGVTPQTASGHLDKLMAGGLIRMERTGREHHHRLASIQIEHLIRTLYAGGAEIHRNGQVQSGSQYDSRLRAARTCGNHIAGRLGVELSKALTNGGQARSAQITPFGRTLLLRWGLDEALVGLIELECGRCLDWSEQVPHLSGAIGAVLLRHSTGLGWVKRHSKERRLTITPAGRHGFRDRFGIVLDTPTDLRTRA
jgi:DNA-binding transcriptional ArsR family regulator